MTTKNKCPKCGTQITYYDGALGYEAMVCRKCGYYADHNSEGQFDGYIAGHKPMKKKNYGWMTKRTKDLVGAGMGLGKKPVFIQEPYGLPLDLQPAGKFRRKVRRRR